MAMIRASLIVMLANCVDVGAVLGRTIILARLLPVDQFGLAATFSILMTIVDTFQNVGLNRMVVQDARAGDSAFLAKLHGAQLLVSSAAAAALAVTAYPLAFVLDLPALAPAYLALALVPLINAAVHLETYRLQRHGRFLPQALRSFLSQPIGLLAIYPAYWWLGDHRAAVVSIIAQQAAAVILTHAAAGQRFRIAFDREVTRAVALFGWPLVVNGLLMFLILNGDRIVVLDQFGPATLGWFSAALMVTLTPANLVAKSLQTVSLGPLARASGDQPRFQHLYDQAVSSATLIALAIVLGTLLCGGYMLTLLFGAKFLPAVPLLTGLACMNALRLLRATPAIAAMARGNTRNPLYANIIRSAGVPVALAAALLIGKIEAMIFAGVLTECISAAAAGRMTRSDGMSDVHYRSMLLLLTLASGSALLLNLYSGYALLALLSTSGLLVVRGASNLGLTRPSITRRYLPPLRSDRGRPTTP